MNRRLFLGKGVMGMVGAIAAAIAVPFTKNERSFQEEAAAKAVEEITFERRVRAAMQRADWDALDPKSPGAFIRKSNNVAGDLEFTRKADFPYKDSVKGLKELHIRLDRLARALRANAVEDIT
ncbi:MAG TPA: hypothetical protein VN861_03300 [Candidatus Acidoferrales bacterium]|nr:hypothetical protein [Candidatus Acidoferrales bacterium]